MSANKEYNVYIDESGDEGIKRGSEWFVLTAIIVPKEYDLTLSNKNLPNIIGFVSNLPFKNISK